MRMYTRWAERRGFEVSVLDLQPAEEAGIKSATLEIKGESVTVRDRDTLRQERVPIAGLRQHLQAALEADPL